MALASSRMSAKVSRCFVGAAVEDLEGGDLVLVVLDELPERLDGLLGPVGGVLGELAGDDPVLAGLVDDLLVGPLHVGEQFADLGLS